MPGHVYLAWSCAPVQLKNKALATGSVVDAPPRDVNVAHVIVPYQDSPATRRLGATASKAWQLFAEDTRAEGAAIAALETEFAGN